MTRAIILAAGRGSRLHPYTENAPKCLTELGGVSLIERQLSVLRTAGIDDIVIATGYLSEMLALPGTRQVHNPDWGSTNMVETLFAAEADFGTDLIVCYADIAYEPKMIDALLRSPHEITVAVNTRWRALWEMRFDNPLDDAESLVLGPDGTILEIGNKVSDIESIEGQFTGLLRFRGAGVDDLRNARTEMAYAARPWKNVRPVEKAYMTDLLMELILSGRPVHAALVDGGWLEIDTVEDFEKTSRLFDDGTIRQFFDGDPIQPPAQEKK